MSEIRLRRSDLRRSVADSEGFSVVEALRDLCGSDEPLEEFLARLNPSQRAVVAVAMFHELAAFDGVRGAVEGLGPSVTGFALDATRFVPNTSMTELLEAALGAEPAWDEIEERWDAEASFELLDFVEAHRADFFAD